MQLVEVLNYTNKIKTVDDLLNHFDAVVEIAKEDIYRIAKSKNIYFADFDFTYADAIDMLREQLKKPHLKAIKKFLFCENIENAISWLITRILANMRNISTNNKYRLYCSPSFVELYEDIKFDDSFESEYMFFELKKFNRDTLKKGIKKIWENLIFEDDFDYLDIEYLCQKYNLDVSSIVEKNDVMNIKKSTNKYSCTQ